MGLGNYIMADSVYSNKHYPLRAFLEIMWVSDHESLVPAKRIPARTWWCLALIPPVRFVSKIMVLKVM